MTQTMMMADESGETPIPAERTQEQEIRDDVVFLAREFLTWLVFFAETEGGEFEGRGEVAPFTVGFTGRLTLRTPAGLVTDMTLKGPSPAGSADLRYALAGGLAVKEAELRLEQGEQVWTFGLAAEHFDLKRLKLPALLGEDGDDPGLERVALLRQLDAALLLAFERFLDVRTGERWGSEVVPAIRAWLTEGT